VRWCCSWVVGGLWLGCERAVRTTPSAASSQRCCCCPQQATQAASMLPGAAIATLLSHTPEACQLGKRPWGQHRQVIVRVSAKHQLLTCKRCSAPNSRQWVGHGRAGRVRLADGSPRLGGRRCPMNPHFSAHHITAHCSTVQRLYTPAGRCTSGPPPQQACRMLGGPCAGR